MDENNMLDDARNTYIRPLKVSLGFSVIGEFLFLIIYGIILFPNGNLIFKVLWALIFCGIGMGATLGAGINLYIVGRHTGHKAIWLTSLLSFLILGVACDLLCLNLDLRFNYFGAQTSSLLFAAGGIFGSLIAGVGIGGLLFSKTGQSIMEQIGI